LEKALAIHGKGKDGATPVRDKSQLIESLRKSLEEVRTFCDQKGVHLAEIESLGLELLKEHEGKTNDD
jgi:hypothetical protein